MTDKGMNAISRLSNVLLNTLFTIFTGTCILPFLLVIMISITDEKMLAKNGYRFIPDKISFYAYQYVLNESTVLIRAYILTITVTLIGTFLSLVIISMIAYPLSLKTFKYRNAFSFFIFFTLLFNGGLVPWYIVCVRVLHIRNTYFALIVPLLVSATYILMMRAYFVTSIPDGLVEYSKVEGAGDFRTFISIIIPLSTPMLATIGLFTSLAYWNDWWNPLILTTDPKYVNLQYLLQKIQKEMDIYKRLQNASGGATTITLANMPSESSRMALCLLTIGPIIFAFPFVQKYFVHGLTIGAVKG